MFTEEERTKLINEAEILSSMNHNYIVKFKDVRARMTLPDIGK
jgi:hypothetical protein